MGVLSHWDCGIRKLTGGLSIVLLIQSLDCYKGASNCLGNLDYTYRLG